MGSDAEKKRKEREQKAMEAEQAAAQAKAEQKKEKAAKKSKKPWIITVTAVILVAAILITGYFLWYKPKHAQQPRTYTDGKSALTQVDSTYTYETAEYNGFTVPAECLDVLKQAEKDIQNARIKYGVAMTVGETEISVPEFGMCYFDAYTGFASGARTDAGGGTLKMDTMPGDQTYLQTDSTWQDKLAEATRNDIQEMFVKFGAALRAGVMLTDAELEEWKSHKTALEATSHNQNIELDEMVARSYSEGVTFNIYLYYTLMRLYGYEYTQLLTKQYEDGLTAEKKAQLFGEDPMEYLYADAHIFCVSPSSEITEKQLKSIHDEDSFLEFASGFYDEKIGFTKEAAAYETRWQRVKRSTLNKKLGGDVAEYIFSADRKDGDVGIAHANMYLCVIYIDKAPYDSHSIDVRQASLFYNKETKTDAPTEEELAAYNEALKNMKAQWEAGDKSAMAMEMLVSEFSADEFASTGGENKNLRRGDADRSAVNWLFDEARKPGDNTVIETGTGCILYLFEESHPEDKDSEYFLTMNYLDKMLSADLENLKNSRDGEINEKKSSMKKAIALGDESIRKLLVKNGTLTEQ